MARICWPCRDLGGGFRIKEVPIVFVNRVLGTSKMSSGIFGEAVFGVIRLKVSSWFKKYK